MSRIGKKPILIPEGVEVKVENHQVVVKGPKGELRREVRPEIKVEVKENQILTHPFLEGKGFKNKGVKAFWGLTRALLFNMVLGVTEGYEKKLEIRGIGYNANIKENILELKVGFSHLVELNIHPGIDISVEKNIISVSGIDKELVGQVAARIRGVSPPEPYKGKGIRYYGEVVRKKVGKKAIAAAT